MTLTASEASWLADTLTRWEYAEYFFTVLVTVGCFGEYVAEFKFHEWFPRKSEDSKKRLEKHSTLLLIAALALELVCLVKTNQLSGLLIGSLSDRAEEAAQNSSQALGESSAAISQSDKAVKGAGLAEGSSARATETSKKAQGAASNALALAHDSKHGLDSVQHALGNASKELTKLKADSQNLEDETKKTESELIDLAVCNSPRVITNWTAGGKTTSDPLLAMAGQKVFIELTPDAEARRAAFNLAGVLVNAKWDVQTPLKFVDGLADGVSVLPSMEGTESLLNRVPDGISTYWHAEEVAERLVNFLHSYNWQANRGWPVNADGRLIRDPNILPAGAIRIQVGLYPAVMYVSPPGQRELTTRLEGSKREREKLLGQKRKREQRLEGLSPELRQRMLDAEADWDARSKAAMAPYTQPCQVLNPFP
ncbi:MAG: hypothetical protein M3Y72_25595 [Acidobacteriota bacterium]|nr:hypothetical protein [Acidobacteriota bacterium]